MKADEDRYWSEFEELLRKAIQDALDPLPRAADWPHTCPRCGGPALNMAVTWDCSRGCFR